MTARPIKSPYEAHLGFRLWERKDGYAKLSLHHASNLTNPYGLLHGGAIVSLADSAMASAVFSKYPGHAFFTTRMNVKFIHPVDKGEVFAQARILREKRNLVYGQVVVTDENDRTVAQANITFFVRPQ